MSVSIKIVLSTEKNSPVNNWNVSSVYSEFKEENEGQFCVLLQYEFHGVY